MGLPLRVGSGGDAVPAAQHLLPAKFGHGEIPVDGLYSRVTEAVVKAFQRDHELTVDGLVGPPQTWPALISITP